MTAALAAPLPTLATVRPQPAANTPGGSSFLAPFSRLVYQFGNPVQLLLRNLGAFGAKQRGNDLLSGAFEKRIDEVFERRLPHFMTRYCRRVDISKSNLLVANMTLVLQYAQLRAYGRVAWIARQIRHDFAGCTAAQAIKNVHDLPLTPCQIQMCSFGHMRLL